jgi:hypothetical protein
LPVGDGSATLVDVWASDLGGNPADLGVEEVADVRGLLRQPDVASRRLALERMDAWSARTLDEDSASAVLRAATQSYPWLRGERTDPADRFAQVLWRWPDSVAVAEVEGAYLIAADRVRRSLLHLLALRRDRAGIASIAFLIGPDGPSDLLPLPTAGLLDPVLDVVVAPSLVPALVSVAARRGWAWHAADLLRRLAVDGRLDDDAVDVVVRGMVPLVEELVAGCDRAVGGDPAVAAEVAGERPSVRSDPSRADRHRLRAVLGLLAELPSGGVQPALLRALAAADPRVAADAAVALVVRGRELPPERLSLIARDAEARGTLIDGLDHVGRIELLEPEARTGRMRAEADLVSWLAVETELGRAPDEIEHVESLATPPEVGGIGEVHLFRFRVRAPHWSSARGWMIGAAGPYRPDGTPGDGAPPFASSIYGAEDEDAPTGHLESILESLAAWPDERDA